MNIEQRKQKHIASYTSAEQQAADIFHARHYPEHFARLEKLLAEKYPDLPEQAKQGLYNNARLSIGMMPIARDDYSQKGNTRFYGLPDLPPDIEWPKVNTEYNKNGPSLKGEKLCKFVAQINLAELPKEQNYLPKQGIIYFFIDSQYDDKRNYNHKIIYYDGDTERLVSGKDLSIQPEDIYDVSQEYYSEDGVFPARVQIFPFISFLYNAYYEQLEGRNKNLLGLDGDEYAKACQKIMHAPLLDIAYPPEIYGVSVGKIRCDLYDFPVYEDFNQDLPAEDKVSSQQGIFVYNAVNANLPLDSYESITEGSPYFRAAELFGGKPENYIVLLRTNGHVDINNFMYGSGADDDNDILYFVIAKEKLKNLDFSQVYCCNTFYWRNY